MKIDQLNNFTAEKVNELIASRFGQRIDLSEENLDNLSAFQNAIARELSEVESNIGFNKAMQHPKYVENKLILDLIVKAIDERQVGEDEGVDEKIKQWAEKYKQYKNLEGDDLIEALYTYAFDLGITQFIFEVGELQAAERKLGKKQEDWGDAEIQAAYEMSPISEGLRDELNHIVPGDEHLEAKLDKIRPIIDMSEERQVGEDMPAKVKRISGTKVDIEDPDEPGITKTVDTTKTDVDVDDTTGELSLDPQDKDKKETPAQQKIRIGQTVKKTESSIGRINFSNYEDEQAWGRMEGDHENLSDEEFEKKYGKTKQEARKLYPIEPNEDINQKEQDSAESYLRYIDELTKELAHDKNSEHFHKDIAHQIQNAVDDLRNNVIGTKPSQARAKFSDQSDQRVVTDPETGKPKWESDSGTSEEGDDIEDLVAPEFEQIIHMLKAGMSPEDIKAKMPDHADTVDQVVTDLAAVTEAMNSMLPEGNTLSGVEQSALRLLVGTKDFMRAKRAIEFAKAGRAIPSDLVAGLKPLFDKIGTFLSAGAGAVKRFGDIEKMIGRTVQKSSTYEEKLLRKVKVKESEIDKAEVALAAKDMVDKVDSMLQDVSQMKGEDLLPLTDKVRDEVGQEASDTLKASVEGSLGELETSLQSARATLDNAARTVAGDPSAGAMADPLAGPDTLNDPLADPMADPTNPDELNTLDVPDAEIGGEDPEGRERRESATPERSKHQIAEAIFKTLSKRSK